MTMPPDDRPRASRTIKLVLMGIAGAALLYSCTPGIGAGMGAAVLYASEFDFHKVGGIELDQELLAIARSNVEAYNRSTGRQVAPEWVAGDFFKWQIPREPQLFFMNNPFPAALTLDAIKMLEASLREHPRPALLVFRKAPGLVGDHLHRSSAWKPLRLAPYWRVYSAVSHMQAPGEVTT